MEYKIEMGLKDCDILYAYLSSCLHSEAKTIEAVYEYLLQYHIKRIISKLKILQEKYELANFYRAKSITITEPEIVCLNKYFKRYNAPENLGPTLLAIQELLTNELPELI